jgi:hypothetical protein
MKLNIFTELSPKTEFHFTPKRIAYIIILQALIPIKMIGIIAAIGRYTFISATGYPF